MYNDVPSRCIIILCTLVYSNVYIPFHCQGNVGADRTRRSRKAINYAELNDVYLPPLSKEDWVNSGQHRPNEAAPLTVYPVNTRSSRRLRGIPEELEDTAPTKLEAAEEEEEEEDGGLLDRFSVPRTVQSWATQPAIQELPVPSSLGSPTSEGLSLSLAPIAPSVASDLMGERDNIASGLVVSVPRSQLLWNGIATPRAGLGVYEKRESNGGSTERNCSTVLLAPDLASSYNL